MGVNNVNAQSKSPLGPKYPLFSFGPKTNSPESSSSSWFLKLIVWRPRMATDSRCCEMHLVFAPGKFINHSRSWCMILMLRSEEVSELWGWHLLGSETAVTTLSVPQWRWTVVDRAGPFQQPFTGRNQNWKHLKTPRRVTWPPVYFITEYFMAPSPPSQEPQLPSLNVDCEQLRLSPFPPTWFHCHHASVSGCSDQRDTSCT